MYLMDKRSNGFTVLEIFFVVLVIGIASIFFFVQKNNIAVSARDEQRKVSINAMYYGLEEVFYPTNKYYPTTIDENNLPSVDPALFTDPDKFILGESGSNYVYEPTDCKDGKCTAYTLRASLENEADFIKTNK